ncbi:MAG: SDR family oxidoreductase [Rhodobacteraceae bacterium]|nr:SDR family oxidoreductase [Paracoccaceae bacterium]
MRRILVTGGGSGFGRALARAFADDGDAVTITGRRASALSETDDGRGMTCRIADITDEDSVNALFDAPFDVVIANAGEGMAGKVKKTSLADWNTQISVNLTGTFLTFRGALQGMETGGRLIAMASSASLIGQANVAAYTAAKHGVLGLVRSLAQEVARDGITVNAVCPYYVETPMANRAAASLQAKFSLSREEAVSKMVANNPVGRLISVDEVTAAVRYLASPEAAMVNGHALSLSGGFV